MPGAAYQAHAEAPFRPFHPRVLAFGLLLTMFSSFGQTFLISIFVPRILESFGLGAGEFGVLYGGVVVAGG